jgi:hypothetical protein
VGGATVGLAKSQENGLFLANLSERTDKNMTMEHNGANVTQNATHVGSAFATAADEEESSSSLGIYSAMALPNHDDDDDDMSRPPTQEKKPNAKYDPVKNRPSTDTNTSQSSIVK